VSELVKDPSGFRNPKGLDDVVEEGASMSKDKTGRALERRVADLFRALGTWKVEHDVPMAGHQIDVYVEMAGPARSQPPSRGRPVRWKFVDSVRVSADPPLPRWCPAHLLAAPVSGGDQCGGSSWTA